MAKQTPKAESEESNRMWASASFVGVLIIIGLPLWWKTTEVYRVALPYDEIAAFDSLSHYVATDLTILANDEATATKMADFVVKAFNDSDVIMLNITKAILPEQLRRTLEVEADNQDAVEEVLSMYPSVPNRFYLVQRRPLFQDAWLGSERVMFFRDDMAIPTAVQALKRWVYQTDVLFGARAEYADTARRIRFHPASEYRILVHTPYELNLEQEFHDYIGSFCDDLSELHNFTITTQSIYMLNFDFHAREVKDTSDRGRHYAIAPSSVSLLLTRLEELAARVPSHDVIHLALCPVSCERAPLVLYGDDDKPNASPIQAFMSPKWGGVVLYNPTRGECESGQREPDVNLIMGAFVSHLRSLLGIVDAEYIPGAHLEPLRSVSTRAWERDALARVRIIDHLTAAERTLKSLAQLLGEISNIVINDDVGASIGAAVRGAVAGARAARAGRLAGALRRARRAAAAAGAAFTDPSLLALLYFPDDQKYAIYIPLFLPIMFPVLLSLRNLFAWTRGKPIHKEKMD